MKRTLIVLFVIVAILVCGCSASPDSGMDSNGTTKTTISTSDEKFTIPGTLTAENFDIKIVAAEVCKSVTLDSGIEFPVEAEEGKELLVLSIDATNTSSELMNLGSLLTYADSKSVLPQNYLGKYNDRAIFVGAVQPGKTIQTYIIYPIPEGWAEFELSYVDGLTMIASNPIKILRTDIA